MKNEPSLWQDALRVPGPEDHKYSRGQVTILGGMEMTGAACLVAHAASRIGAGLVNIVSPTFHYQKREGAPDPTQIYRSFMPHIIVRENTSLTDYMKQSETKGINVCVIGPGLGLQQGQLTRSIITGILSRKTPIVLDADALSVFQNHAKELIDTLHDNVVITPHEGEFKRIFSEIETKGKDAAERASHKILATVVLKGAKTVIAKQARETVVNDDAPHNLATAGTGDVLAGMIAGLMAGGMDPFKASCAGVWIHAKAAKNFGHGLISSDLPDLIPPVLQELLGNNS